MEWLETLDSDNQGVQVVLLCLQRYYFYYRKQFLPYNKKWVYFCHCSEIVQLLSLLIPPDSSLSLPWNYSLCQSLWSFLSFLSRPDTLLLHLTVSPLVITCLYTVLVTFKILSSLCISIVLGTMDTHTFSHTVNEPFSTVLHKPIFILNYLFNLLFRLLFVPITAYYMLQISHLSLPFQALYLFLTLLTITVRVIDTAYIGTTTWFQKDIEAIAVCSDRIYLFLAKIIQVIICSMVDFRTNSLYFSAGLMISGLYGVLKVTYTVPFHDIRMNCIVIIKAEIALWGGFCVFLGSFDSDSQETMKITLLFLLLFPGFTVLIVSRLQGRLEASLRNHLPTKPLYQIEHSIRLLLKTDSYQVIDTAFHHAFTWHPHSSQLVVWSLYYYHYLKDTTFLQVSISRLMKLPWGVMSFVECLYCVFLVENWLNSLPEHAEAISFVTLQQALIRVTQADNEATRAHYELFTELSNRNFRISRVLRLSETLKYSMKNCVRFYRQLLKSHPGSSEVLSRYSGLLHCLTSSKAALKYQSLAQREVSRMHAKRSEQTVDLYDPNCMIVVMSLERENIGVITWAQNVELLGFNREEVIGTDHSAVIPPPLKATHLNKLKRITEFRHHHPVYESRHLLYFSNRQGLLVGAHWKVRLVNIPGTGDMSIIAALKKRKDAPVLAFIGEDSQSVVSMVSPYSDQRLPTSHGRHPFRSLSLRLHPPTSLRSLSLDRRRNSM